MSNNNSTYEMGMKKLKYLLVMPRLVQNIGDGYSFPLGIAYISASMKKAGFSVFTLNLNHRCGEVADIIAREVVENGIDVVATGGLSFQYQTIRLVVEATKKAKIDTITVVGGGIISGDPEPAMDALEYADIGILGEGEETICELCHALEHKRDISSIAGVIYRRNNSFIITSPRKEIADIDSIPWPDYAGFEIDKYLQAPPPGISGLNMGNTIFMLASRSCPYNCTFCFHTVGKKYRQRSLVSFFEELDYLVSMYNVKFICMADELFARDIHRVKEFCERIRKYQIKWWAQFRVDDITPELLHLLKDGGCEVMSFGLESADNKILKSMRKHTTVEQIERTLKLVHGAGISMEGAFIFGDIEETVISAQNTLTWWREHPEYRITLNLITVYPGSFLYKYAIDKGIIKDRIRFLKDGCPQVNVSKMNDRQFSEMLRNIIEAPVSLVRTLTSVESIDIEPKTGRIGLRAICPICNLQGEWNNVKLFTMNFLSCKGCGQKYNVPLFPELRRNIDNNLKQLTNIYGKIAIWGINYHSFDLFRFSSVLCRDSFYPVDISETKRKMGLYGKTINSPDIIRTEGIAVVVVAVPVYLTQIASQISVNYPNVVWVIDICSLINPEYVVDESTRQQVV